MSTLRIHATFLLFFTCTLPQAYCASEALGLAIDWSRLKLFENRTSADVTQDKISIEWLTSIDCNLQDGKLEKITYNSEGHITRKDADTDTEEEENLQKATLAVEKQQSSNQTQAKKVDNEIEKKFSGILQKTSWKKINRSRDVKLDKDVPYDGTRNYIRNEYDDDFLHQLSTDALAIANACSNSRTRLSTTCLCVALRDKHKYVKKFALHNGKSVMTPDMRKKAHELGYDVIQAEQAHAEVQCIQFLLDRHKKRPVLYTHIMGMGCSKCHCAECDHILKRVLGSNYYEGTASVMQKRSKDLEIGPVSATSKTSSSYEAKNSDVSFTQTIAYEVVKGKKAVDDATALYNNYYLPECLKRVFGEDYDFSNKRFTKPPRQNSSRE